MSNALDVAKLEREDLSSDQATKAYQKYSVKSISLSAHK